jgi:Ca-activated chloride channel homolog
VSAVDSQTALNGLRNGWDISQLGPQPQAWIADSTLWTNQLAAGSLGGDPRSIATSPIVLAMPSDGARAVESAIVPTFADIPGLVARPDGWSAMGQPSWGRFTIALPNPVTNAASALAVEAMIDPATAQGQPPLSPALLESGTVRRSLDSLAGTQPTPAPATSHQALLALGGADTVAHAPFGAVPVSEAELYERNLGIDGDTRPMNVLDEVRLGGPTPFEDFPFTPLASSVISADQIAAAMDFRAFVLTANAQTMLSQAGFRVADNYAHPLGSPGMDWGSVTPAATPTDAAGYGRFAASWSAAAAGPAH